MKGFISLKKVVKSQGTIKTKTIVRIFLLSRISFYLGEILVDNSGEVGLETKAEG